MQNFPAAIGSMGMFKLPTSWSTVRTGVFGIDDGGIGAGGVEGELRLHAPTRFTPYIGLQGNAGISGLRTGQSRHYTNAGHRQNVTTLAGIVAIVPEAGVSYWVNSSTRLNAGASYFVASSQSDFLLFGISLEFVLDSPVADNGNAPNRIPGSVPPLTNESYGQWNSQSDSISANSRVYLSNGTTFVVPQPLDDPIVATPIFDDRQTKPHSALPADNDLPAMFSTQSDLLRPNTLPSLAEAADRLSRPIEVPQSEFVELKPVSDDLSKDRQFETILKQLEEPAKF